MTRELLYFRLEETCPVCMEPYAYGDSIMQIQCDARHILHYKCYIRLQPSQATGRHHCVECRALITDAMPIPLPISTLAGAIIAHGDTRLNYRTAIIALENIDEQLNLIYEYLLIGKGNLPSAEAIQLCGQGNVEQIAQLRRILFKIFHFNLEQSYQIAQSYPALLNHPMQHRLVDLMGDADKQPCFLLSNWLASNMDCLVQLQQRIPELRTMNMAQLRSMIQAQDSSGLAAWLREWSSSTPFHKYLPLIDRILAQIHTNDMTIDMSDPQIAPLLAKTYKKSMTGFLERYKTMSETYDDGITIISIIVTIFAMFALLTYALINIEFSAPTGNTALKSFLAPIFQPLINLLENAMRELRKTTGAGNNYALWYDRSYYILTLLVGGGLLTIVGLVIAIIFMLIIGGPLVGIFVSLLKLLQFLLTPIARRIEASRMIRANREVDDPLFRAISSLRA